MKLPIRRKVLLLTVALSLALIAAAVYLSYALYSGRVQRDEEENCQTAADNMAREMMEYHGDFLAKLQQEIDEVYRANTAEIEEWSYHYDTLEDRNNYFEEITVGVFPPKNKFGLSYEKSVFLNDYNNLRALLNVSSAGVGMQDAAVFYLDRQRGNRVYLVDSVTSQSPLHHPPGSVDELEEEMIAHVVDRESPEPYTQYDYICTGVQVIRLEGLEEPLYIQFQDTMDEAYSHRKSFMMTISLVMLAATALLALVYLLFVDKFISKNIEKLSAATESFTAQMEAGTALQPVPAGVKTRDELGDLSGRLDLMQSKLVEYVETIGEKTAKEESLKAELNLASRIQIEALPPSGFEAGDFRIDSFLQPAKEVGGDLYDYFMVDDNHLFFVVADVSGKGVPAALFMMRGKELIKAHAGAGRSLGEIAKAVNLELCRGNEEGLFITAFFGMVEHSTRRLTYARAGHEQPFLMRAGKAWQISEESNFMLGLFDSFDFAEDSLILEPGDRLLVFTDGLNEGINPANEAFGYERIQAVLEETEGNTLPALHGALTAFAEGAEQFDDVTMLQLSFTPSDGPGERCWCFAPPAFQDITTVCDGIHEALSGAPEDAVSELCLLADEVMNNCISYAYEGVEAPRLQVDLKQEGSKVVLLFADNGIPYNPLELDSSEHISQDIITRNAGGMGIHFIKSFASAVEYEYRDGENRLRVEKAY